MQIPACLSMNESLTLKNLIKTRYFCYSKNTNKKMYTNVKIRIYPACIYLLKINNENSRTRCVIWKRHQNDLIDIRTLRNINIPLASLYLFLVFHSWISGSAAGWVNQQKLKYRQVKNMKHTRADANYPVLTKQVKLPHKKKPVLNLKL